MVQSINQPFTASPCRECSCKRLTQGFLFLVVKYLGESRARERARDRSPESVLPIQGCHSIPVALGGRLSVMAWGRAYGPVVRSRTWVCTEPVSTAASPLLPAPDDNLSPVLSLCQCRVAETRMRPPDLNPSSLKGHVLQSSAATPTK